LWMLNFPDYVFSKDVFIYGSDYRMYAAKPQQGLFRMSFFPEGGDVIAGLPNRIAFKIIDENGNPVTAKGFITDRAENRVADFETEHDGMGMLYLDAEAGKQYLANIPSDNGSVIQFKLPTVKQQGITLKADNQHPQKLSILVMRPPQHQGMYGKIHIVAQSGHHPLFKADLDLDADQNGFSINKKDLPAGIVHITAFDEKNIPLAERLVFIPNYEVLAAEVQTDSLRFKPRNRNELSFTIPRSGQSTVSVLVTDAGVDSLPAEQSLLSSLLLTSDLKGPVLQPQYYFRDKSAVTLRHLDLLMMTQGWRRFDWKKLAAGNFPALNYPVESGIWISGHVTKSDRKEPVKDGKVEFVVRGEDSTSIMAEAQLTDRGEFLLNDLHFRKKASIGYQGTNNKTDKLVVDVHIDPSYIDTLTRSARRPERNLDTSEISKMRTPVSQYLFYRISMDTNLNRAGYLGNVTVTARKLSRPDSLNEAYTTGPFSMGKAIDPASYQYYTTPWQMLQAAVPGIRVEGNPYNPDVYMSRYQGLDAMSSNTGNQIALGESSSGESVGLLLENNGIAYFLNEVNVSKDIINTLSVSDIALIKVLKTEAAALGATQGAILFYTKKGAVPKSSGYERAFTSITREGYALVRQFYSPDPTLMPATVSDKRATLYWNAAIRPDKQGQFRFRFFNNDSARSYRIIIQGIDADGQLIYTEQVVR
ncbi:MAG TPA: hypothetical protein VF145_07545, partial [Chitinophagaceae bacterium]